ncbi:hypothetical protein [Polyangium sp. 15x6]|uniref:hypothetical protein n=1 Tax=Polyangium sp. 15x6 TaxID=3042687 RepID=UPI00249ADD2D|nr:hypothetical protein [Polyangium sp. 15x6]MDI3287627.1 hypothetical protein [Polyangium sp. 15x6]
MRVAKLGLVRHLGTQKLDGHGRADVEILGLVDGSVPAFSDPPQDAVLPVDHLVHLKHPPLLRRPHGQGETTTGIVHGALDLSGPCVQ